MEKQGLLVLSGNSHPDLAKLVVDRLGISLGDCNIYRKPNTETSAEIRQSLRANDVYIIQTGTNKQCRMRRRNAIVVKLVAQMLSKAGANRLITMDLYRKEIQGFFDFPVENLRASPFLLQYIKEKIPDYRNAVIVARNAGVMNKATSYAERLRLNVAVVHGEPKDSESDGAYLDEDELEQDIMNEPGYAFEQYVKKESSAMEYMPVLAAKEKPPLTVVGDVGGRIAIMVDDLVDDVNSFVSAAEVLKESGAYKIYVIATHGILSADAPRLLENSDIDEVVVTNTIPHEIQKMHCHKIKTVDVSLMISEAIRRTYHCESMSYLFRDVICDD